MTRRLQRRVDPREADWSTLGLLRELGFNRVSLGVQDLDPEVQRAVNRLQSLEQTQAVMDAARALAYRSVSMDLMYGLPGQTQDSLPILEQVLEMKPDRLALHNYVHLPQLHASQRHIDASRLPSRDERLAIYAQSQRQLQAGYRYIGMSQFALPDDDLSLRETGMLTRGLQGYVPGEEPNLLGFGLGAISQVGDLCCRNTGDVLGSAESGPVGCRCAQGSSAVLMTGCVGQ